MEKVISLQKINFAYPGRKVLQDFNLDIYAGDIVFLQGPNGCGKSTLFKIINGLQFPESGKYLYKNQEINAETLKDYKLAKRLHKDIGYVFQNPEVQLFNGNVFDEIAFGPRQMGFSEAEVTRRVETLLELLGIQHLAARAPYQLSGGEQKKTAVAAVLALNPEILVMDEPFNGLDRKSRVWLKAFLQEFSAAGKTLIIATHEDELLNMPGARIIEFEEE